MKVRLVFFGLFLLVHIAYAQDADPVQYIGIERGLSNNAVTSIYQDHDGFMWFGTYDGLNRYDGYTFKVFRNIIGDTSSLGDNHVSTIEGDADHNLWIGCEKGVYVYSSLQSKFTNPRFKPWNQNSLQLIKDNVPVIRCINNGANVLLGVSSKGLIVFEKNNLVGVQIPLYGISDAGNYSVTSMAYDRFKKQTWVLVQNVGLCLYNVSKKTLQIINTSVKGSDCLKVDSRGNLWMGNENGLFLYDFKSNRFSENKLPAKYRVIQLFEDKQNTLWIASDGGGVWSMSLNSLQPKPYVSSDGTSLVNSNAVYSIYEDSEGRKWIGTLRGGVNLIQPHSSSFKHITYNVSLSKY